MAEIRQQLAYLLAREDMQEENIKNEIAKYREIAKMQEQDFFSFLGRWEMEGNFSGFGYLIRMFELDVLERHCILMTWYARMYGDWERDGIYGKEGITLYGIWSSFPWELSVTEFFREISAFKKRPFLGVFFRENVYFLKETCYLHEYVIDFLNGEYDFGKHVRLREAERGKELFFYGGEEKFADVKRMLGEHENWKTQNQRKIFLFFGEDGIGKHTMAHCLAGRLGLDLLEADMKTLEKNFWATYILMLRLHMLCPLVCLEDADEGSFVFETWYQERQLLPFLFLIARKEPDGLFEAAARAEIELFSFPMQKYPSYIQEEIWKKEGMRYPAFVKENAVFMAERFDLSVGQIRQILGIAEQQRRKQQAKSFTEKLLQDACAMVLSRNMGKKAYKTEAFYRMEDLVLPAQQKQLLLQACAQVKNRHFVFSEWEFSKKIAYGRGISMIFAGPPGTGKTMAALVVANCIGMTLYKVNLPAVVSKYIGDTEKNLEEIFDYAAKSQVILFFDEADVIFSKRTEVKEANDKYNNMEAAFLLQKMEQHEGVVILATNFLKNMDAAFRRRIRFIINFPFPEAKERKKIWQRVFPEKMPCEELDWDFLSEEFELSGSSIKNIALLAAFLAAEENEIISMKYVIKALRQEYEKNGKILGKEELKEYAI